MRHFRDHFGRMDPTRVVDLGPRAIVSILENSKDIRERHNLKIGHHHDKYSDKFFDKMKIHKNKLRDSDILLKGVWAEPVPFFRL